MSLYFVNSFRQLLLLKLQRIVFFTLFLISFVGVAQDISINDPVPVAEGNSGPTTLTFTVTISESPLIDLTVDYSTVGGDSPSGTLTFLALTATLSQPVVVTTTGDTVPETDEAVTVTLANASINGNITKASGSSSFTNDDPYSATITATDALAAEDPLDAGQYTVSLDVPAEGDLTINYTINASSTATAGDDYTALTGTVVILDTQSSATIALTPINDTDVEGDETVVVDLATGTGYDVGTPGSATVTISSEDLPPDPVATITATDALAAEDPLDAGQYTVSLDVPAEGDLTINYTINASST
ncbi:MAG: hypothetical protein HKP38_11530, partial [Croceitalea sp.]|nr:hypothetical protein [Croceitalea sp.]